MIGYNINGVFVDFYENTSINFEINTPIYTGGDPTNIPGSFSFPTTVPLTAKNKILLNHPHRIDNHDKFVTIENVVFYGNGVPIFKGNLVVSNATEKDAKVTMIINPLSTIKKKKVAELVDDVFETTDSDQMKSIVPGTISNPNDFDFAFFPVFNREWLAPEDRISGDGEYKYMLTRTQNFYDVDSQKFVFDRKNIGCTPFLKAKYLIYKIIEATGLTFIDEFFDDELSQLYFYNNYSISKQSGNLESIIDYKNHVPDMEATELLKQFCSVFFLGLFTNPFDGTITLRKLSDVTNGEVNDNWTSKASKKYGITDNDSITPNKYHYSVDSTDGLSTTHIEKDFEIYKTVDQDIDIPELPEGFNKYWYVSDQNEVFLLHGISPTIISSNASIYKYFFPHIVDTGSGSYEIKMSPIFMTRGLRSFSYTYSIFVPEISIRGVHSFASTDENDNQDNEDIISAPRLMFYRGIQPTKNGKSFPMGSNHNINRDGEKIGNYSLLLNGEDGIIEKFGKGVVQFMQNRRTVQRIMHLNITDILNFSPEKKERIENMNYFVSKMKIKFTSKGLKPVNCTLESVR